MMYPTLMKSQSMRSKRKSAVELLAESKPFYVKSEVVRDTTQALPTRPLHSNISGVNCGTYGRSKSVNVSARNPIHRSPPIPQCEYNIQVKNCFLFKCHNSQIFKFDFFSN